MNLISHPRASKGFSARLPGDLVSLACLKRTALPPVEAEILVGGPARRIAFDFLFSSACSRNRDVLTRWDLRWWLSAGLWAAAGSALFPRGRGPAFPPPNPFGSI